MKARPGPRLILDQVMADKIMKLVAYGVKTEAICERFGISKWAVYQAKYKSSMGGVRKYYPPKAK